jgi:hypothetical protein
VRHFRQRTVAHKSEISTEELQMRSTHQLEADFRHLKGLDGETLGQRCNSRGYGLCAGGALVLVFVEDGLVRDGEEEELEHTHVGGAHHLWQNALRDKSLETVCSN